MLYSIWRLTILQMTTDKSRLFMELNCSIVGAGSRQDVLHCVSIICRICIYINHLVQYYALKFKLNKRSRSANLRFSENCGLPTCVLSGYAVRCALYTLRCTLYAVRRTLCAVRCTPYAMRRTLCAVHCTLCAVRCTLHAVRCAPYAVRCALYTLRCALYAVRRTLGKSMHTRRKQGKGNS